MCQVHVATFMSLKINKYKKVTICTCFYIYMISVLICGARRVFVVELTSVL